MGERTRERDYPTRRPTAAIDDDTTGSERITVDSDLLAGLYADDAALTMRRMRFDLLRLGVDPEDVGNLVYENPKRVLGLPA
jgi:hypothetical protein